MRDDDDDDDTAIIGFASGWDDWGYYARARACVTFQLMLHEDDERFSIKMMIYEAEQILLSREKLEIFCFDRGRFVAFRFYVRNG